MRKWNRLFVLLTFAAFPVFAQSECKNLFRKYDQMVSENRFFVTRRLANYFEILPWLEQTLVLLSREQVWMDGGSGGAVFFKDYVQEQENNGKRDFVRLIATGITRPHEGTKSLIGVLENYSKKIQEKENEGDFSKVEKSLTKGVPVFRSFYGTPMEELPVQTIGKVDLITDVFGALSYSKDPGLVLQKYGELLNPGGKLMFSLDHGFKGNDGKFYFEVWRVKDSRNREISILEWIKRVQGFKVSGLKFFPDSSGIRASLVFERTNEALKVPPLKRLEFLVSKPPLRVYRSF